MDFCQIRPFDAAPGKKIFITLLYLLKCLGEKCLTTAATTTATTTTATATTATTTT